MIFNCSKINLVCRSEYIAQQHHPRSPGAGDAVAARERRPRGRAAGREGRDAAPGWAPQGWTVRGVLHLCVGPRGLPQVRVWGPFKDRRTQTEVRM